MIRFFSIILISLLSTAQGAELVTTVECSNLVPDGKYFVKTDQGVVRIEGTYQLGNKNGDFIFYSSDGQKLIELPYLQDKIAGTVRAWHHPDGSARTKTLKLFSEINNGYIKGKYQTWYANGIRRSNFVIDDGDIKTGEIWNEDGSAIDIKAKADFLANDIESDFRYYHQLEQVLDAHQPSC